MTTLYKYGVYCVTDSKFEYAWGEEEPTKCPVDTAHTINATLTKVVNERVAGEVIIKEESIPTGGHFGARTIRVDASRNKTAKNSIVWEIPVSPLAVNFVTTSDHVGDCVEMLVGENTIVGILLGATSGTADSWVSQNYTTGDIVEYTHPLFGNRVYTCISDTTANDLPTNETYWKRGYEVHVSQTVIDNVAKGYYITLDDGTNSDDMGIVIDVDKVNDKLYLEKNGAHSFSPATPTYIKQTVKHIHDFEVGEAWEHVIGESKIGGTYLPPDTFVTVKYMNKSSDKDKFLIGRVEYLY